MLCFSAHLPSLYLRHFHELTILVKLLEHLSWDEGLYIALKISCETRVRHRVEPELRKRAGWSFVLSMCEFR